MYVCMYVSYWLFTCCVQFPVYFQVRDFFFLPLSHIRMTNIDRNKYSINVCLTRSSIHYNSIIVPRKQRLFFFFLYKQSSYKKLHKKYSKSILSSFSLSLSLLFLHAYFLIMIVYNSTQTGFFLDVLHRFFQGLSFHLVTRIYIYISYVILQEDKSENSGINKKTLYLYFGKKNFFFESHQPWKFQYFFMCFEYHFAWNIFYNGAMER